MDQEPPPSLGQMPHSSGLVLRLKQLSKRDELGEWPRMEGCGGGWLGPGEDECNSEVNASCL